MSLDSLLRLDVSNLRKMDALATEPGEELEVRLSWGDSAAINVMVTHGTLRLVYDCNCQPRDYRVMLERTPCNYGGERTWLMCPASGCKHRVAVLYLYGGVFVCRHCTGLLYDSQLTTANWRAKGQEWKLRTALGVKPGDIRPACMIPRAKGRHRKTHDRLIAKLQRLERMAAARSWSMIKRLAKRADCDLGH